MAEANLPDDPAPGDLETLDDPADGFLIGEDEWIDVTPGSDGTQNYVELGPIRKDGSVRPAARQIPFAQWLWAALALGLVTLALIAWRVWVLHKRSRAPLMIESSLTAGVRAQLKAEDAAMVPTPPSRDPNDKPRPAFNFESEAQKPPRPEPLVEPEPEAPVAVRPADKRPAPQETQAKPPAEPQPLHLSLNVISATRSVMMFTLEFRLTLTNRGDAAVRDVAVSGQLACARRGQSNAPSLGTATPLSTVDRVGPRQSRTITAKLQIPMKEVSAIRQGDRPLFIPLLHITLEGEGQRADATSFVIGTPSEMSEHRVHPLALDAPVGTIRDLRANEVQLSQTHEPA